MNAMKPFGIIGMVILVIGGLNWGLVGLFDFNLVSFLFGEMSFISRAVYVLVGISAIGVAFGATTSIEGVCRTKTPTT
jgi:uncharacterized protein